jgi:cytoskeletal protein CcmA (bactofilin family)
MFSKGKKPKTAKIDTIIGEHSEIQGDVHFSGGLHIDGAVKGNVVADRDGDSVLTLSEHGRIEGEVRVPNVILNGAVEGDVHAAQRIELAPHAKVTGNVFYNLIEMAMGAEVNGSLVHRVEAAKPVLNKSPESSSDKELRKAAEPVSSPVKAAGTMRTAE